MRQRTASRRVRVRSGKAHRNKARPPAVLLHDVKQPASRPSPRSTSRSRGAFFAPGSSRRVSLSPPHSPLHVPALRRARAQILGVSCSSGPENERAGGTPGGVTAVVALVSARHSRLRGVPVPRNRDVRLSALHRGVAQAPLRLRHFRRSRGKAGSPTIVHGRLRTPGSTAVTSRGRRHTPLRRQDRLRRRPS